MNRVAFVIALGLVVGCRDRNSNNSSTSTTVPTQVAPAQPMLPPPPMPVAPNALADAGPPPMPIAPNALADAGVAPTQPVVAQPTVPTQPAAPSQPTAPSQPSTGTGTGNTVNIPSPVQGVPGVQVRRGHGSTTVNVGGIRIAVPTQ
ncbi:MAG: hypothetical protein U0326_24810 [Polyangiales bacterium]